MTIKIDRIWNLIPEKNKRLVIDFFVVFSRFEFALKKAGFLEKPKDQQSPKIGSDAKPDWNGFADKHSAKFYSSPSPQLNAAIKYFEVSPPMKQIYGASGIEWAKAVGSEPRFTLLLIMVRRVRNNLFHGGKFSSGDVDSARDSELLNYSLTILDACLSLDPEVNKQFFGDHS